MAAGNVTISLPQMIDLALSIPEHGSVNFHLLQSLLHILVQQMELVQCQVEFRGKDGEKVQQLLTIIKPEPTIKVTEYVVSPPKDAGKVLHRKPPSKDTPASPNEVSIGEAGSQLETVVVVENVVEGSEPYVPCVISRQFLDKVNTEVEELKVKVNELAELPGNAALLEALRTAGIDKSTPVLDMFRTMTLAKKVEATEDSVEKLASIVEDLAKQGSLSGVQIPGAGSLGEALGSFHERLTNIENFLDSSTGSNFKPGSPPTAGGYTGDMVAGGGPGGAGGFGGGVGGGAGAGGGFGGGGGGSGGQAGRPGPTTGGDSLGSHSLDIDLTVPNFSKMSQEEFTAAVERELHKIKEEIKLIYDRIGMLFGLNDDFSADEIYSAIKNVIKKHKQNVTDTGGTDTELPPEERLERLEDRFNGTDEQIASLDSTFNQEINNLHTQFADMEKAFGNIMEKIHFGMPGGDSAVAGETLGELYDKLMSLQSDMENLAETASKLLEDKEDKQRLIEVLTEQVEFLKTVKADKEDLEDALADKADACAINRKVSHDQFDTACDELSRGIEEALAKLTQQEELWQQALNEIQKEIGNKLDRMELGPLRDFVNNKLKMLQQRLKALTALKKETEAAGTKKFLRNVNCISCDKDVVMRKEMDSSLYPQPYALPPSRSMGPYLAYELDALRKQQKSLPNSRNLNHFESALQQKSPRAGEDHICNRYCGGSHTITTPQQRVTRLGHFLNQWGPEAQAVIDSSRTTTREDEKLTVVGTSTASPAPDQPKVSKIESADKHETNDRRPTTTGDGKRSLNEKRKLSAQKMSATGSRTSATEPPAERRRSSVSSAQRSRRSSQVSSGTAVKESPQVSGGQIAEETASQIAKETESEAVEASASPKQSKISAQSPSMGSAQKPPSKGSVPTIEGGETPAPEETPAEASPTTTPADE